MKDILGFIVDHWQGIAQALFVLWGVLVVSGRIKNQRIIELYEIAVLFVEQWRKVQEKGGSVVTPDVMKDKAVRFLESRLPNGLPVDEDLIEAMVAKVTTSRGQLLEAKIGEVVDRQRDALGRFIAQ